MISQLVAEETAGIGQLGDGQLIRRAFADVAARVYEIAKAVVAQFFKVVQIQQLNQARISALLALKKPEPVMMSDQLTFFRR